MSDQENQESQELQKCSDCGCTMLVKYFSFNKKGERYKCCDSCREKRKKRRADPEYKKKRQVYLKKYCKENAEKINTRSKKHYEENKERKLSKGKEWRENNKERMKELTHEWYKNNKENHNKISKEWRENNKERVKEQQINWRQNNKERINETSRKYLRHRRATDPAFKITDNLRRRVNGVVHGCKSAHTMELIGCSQEELREYLEQQFEEGMSWDNYNHATWHIDHILPCASFDLTDPEQQRKCFHYTNLQPLWAIDNLSKGDKLDWTKE